MPPNPLLSDVFFYGVVCDFLILQFILEMVTSYFSNAKFYDSADAVCVALYEFVLLLLHKESALSIIVKLQHSTLF